MPPNVEGGLLYWDAGSQTMKIAWWEQMNATARANVIHTKFGSTVGFTFNGDGWDSGDVKFNPTSTTYASTAAGYTSIPAYSGTASSEGYISSTAYHTLTNVKAGLGDICMLAGYTAAQVKGWTALPTKPTYRLPTNIENALLIGDGDAYDWDDSVTPPIGIFSTGYSLPMIGNRAADGSIQNWLVNGQYWSSTPSDQSPAGGYNMDFGSYPSYRPYDVDVSACGHAIRCVKAN